MTNFGDGLDRFRAGNYEISRRRCDRTVDARRKRRTDEHFVYGPPRLLAYLQTVLHRR